jgi:hypothetical protein
VFARWLSGKWSVRVAIKQTDVLRCTVRVISRIVTEWGSPETQHTRIVTCRNVQQVWAVKGGREGLETTALYYCIFCDVSERWQIVNRVGRPYDRLLLQSY